MQQRSKQFLLLCIFLLVSIPLVQAQQGTQDLLTFLKQLPEVSVKEVAIELRFRQAIDHTHPEAGTFEQRVFLLHKGFDRPVVLWLEGYAARANRPQEITQILDANQIIVEHRYFGESVPDSLDWRYLTIQQAAWDHHQIVQAFKKVYHGKWVSSGISKGGQTTMYHRRFYPDDVDVSVCYVAPLNFSDQDSRVYDFLESVGTAECRKKILNFQKMILKEKDTLLPLFENYSKRKGFTYKIGTEAAFEYCVLEYSFAFWQWGNAGCEQIPGGDDGIEKIFHHFVTVSDPSYFSDQGIDYYKPFFYQALTQIGYYGYDTTPFKGLLSEVKRPTFSFCAPENVLVSFDPSAMKDIHDWITRKGDRMIFIYGGNDPWSATAVQLNGQTDAYKFVKEGGDHRTRIRSFSPEVQDQICRILERWLGMNIEWPF